MPYKTHVYSAPQGAFMVNSFLLEGEDSVVIIDAQFLVSSARELREQLRAIGKPLAALVVTHPHPDHYNGAATLLDGLGDIPILATEATNSGIRATAEEKRAFWTPSYGADYPQIFRYPNRIIRSGETIAFGDVVLTIEDIGPGESTNNVVIYGSEGSELFASDLLYSGCHPWLAEGRSALWLEQLDEVERRFRDATRVHAGHGASGDLRLIDMQRAYIEGFRAAVQLRMDGAALAEGGKVSIHEEVVRRYRGYPLEFLIDFNTDAMVQEIAADQNLQAA